MRIWLVMDGDENGDWVVAAYSSEALARDHEDRIGHLHVVESEVLSALPDDVAAIDPVEAKRSREVESAEARRKYQEGLRTQAENAARIDAMTIDSILSRGGRPSLCHCRTFSKDHRWITSNGYCRFCGGWTPEVFRAALGEPALYSEIDKLALHHRIAMREMVRGDR